MSCLDRRYPRERLYRDASARHAEERPYSVQDLLDVLHLVFYWLESRKRNGGIRPSKETFGRKTTKKYRYYIMPVPRAKKINEKWNTKHETKKTGAHPKSNFNKIRWLGRVHSTPRQNERQRRDRYTWHLHPVVVTLSVPSYPTCTSSETVTWRSVSKGRRY